MTQDNSKNVFKNDPFLRKALEEQHQGVTIVHKQAQAYVVSALRTMIASLHFLTFNDDVVTYIKLVYKNEEITVFLAFSQDAETREATMTPSVMGGNEKIIMLTFTNFENHFSVWNRSAYPIGNIGKYPLYARAKITLPPSGENYHEVLITFYVEDIEFENYGESNNE